jgi:hypothetical protein
MGSEQDRGAVSDEDRRTDPRMSTRLEAVVEDAEHGTLRFTASGFSRTGAFLQRRDNTTPLPAVGSTVQLVFNWPLDTKLPSVRVEATVIRQTDDGVGVRFQLK